MWFWNRLVTNKFFWKKYLIPADIYDCNDPDTLSAGVMGKKIFGAKLVYDSHEFWKGTRRKETNFLYTLYSYIGNTIHYLREKKYVKHVDRIITVSKIIQEKLFLTYKKPTYLIMNMTKKTNYKLNYDQKIKDKIIVFAGSKYRLGVDSILNLFYKNGFKVIIIGNVKTKNPNYTYTGFILKQDYMKIMSKALLGVAYMEVNCDNFKYCMPNKLFEYLQVGVIPIVNTETIELADFVKENRIGIEFTKDKIKMPKIDFRVLQNRINKIKENYTWNTQEPKFMEVYDFE